MGYPLCLRILQGVMGLGSSQRLCWLGFARFKVLVILRCLKLKKAPEIRAACRLRSVQ